MNTTHMVVSFLLMVSQCSAKGKLPLPKGSSVMQDFKEFPKGQRGKAEVSYRSSRKTLPCSQFDCFENEAINESENQDETSNLKWVPIKEDKIPNNTVGIFNEYSSQQEYVCRANDYCTFGIFSLGKGLVCTVPFLPFHVVHASNFDVLVNKDNFELLEWKPGSKVSDPGIKFCRDNFVGRNEYGLGDVYKGYLYLPWASTEYWYSGYDVLTVNREPFELHYSDVKYFINEANKTKDPPYTVKMSKVMNYDDREVTETVRMEVTTEKTSQWDCGLSVELSTSTTITTGIPDFISASITIGVSVTVSLSHSSSVSESITQAQEVQIQIPPGHYCIVKMVGQKVKVDIPFVGHATKTYNGKTHECTVTGLYTGVEVGEIITEVDHCEPMLTTTPKPNYTTPTPKHTTPSHSSSTIFIPASPLFIFAFGVVLFFL